MLRDVTIAERLLGITCALTSQFLRSSEVGEVCYLFFHAS